MKYIVINVIFNVHNNTASKPISIQPNCGKDISLSDMFAQSQDSTMQIQSGLEERQAAARSSNLGSMLLAL